jgi:regulator of nucleoside diphosphate kinase
VYPREARDGTGCVSVLAPIGAALLGLQVGQAIDWPLPGGRTKRLRIVEVPYQPEAAGHVGPKEAQPTPAPRAGARATDGA